MVMNENDKTHIFNYGGTNPKSIEDKTQQFSNSAGLGNSDKTVIIGQGSSTKSGANTTKRKLAGWLVSFTLDEAGTDFRIFEGKNKLGRDLSNDIRVLQDAKISGEHATLLFRGNELFVQDELASNPSYLNKQEILPGQTVNVVDGDLLQFGDNEFIFRKACK
jgi:pSer/pThr/pTyr-binding forkhead associated (FHA) protein